MPIKHFQVEYVSIDPCHKDIADTLFRNARVNGQLEVWSFISQFTFAGRKLYDTCLKSEPPLAKELFKFTDKLVYRVEDGIVYQN